MMGLMTGKPRRTLALLTSLLLFGPLPLPLLLAQGQGPQRVPVPIPPLPKLPTPAKKDRSGLPPIPTFKDVAKEVGLTAVHIAAPEAHYVIDSTSGGAGLFDCDDDGRLDAVLVNGSTVERYRARGDPLVTRYHQEADGTFKDVTKEAGLTRRGWGMGVAVADYDNDGKVDLFVTGFGGSALYHALGNCKFEDVTEKAGVVGSGFMTGAAWGDYDRDGFVDLFVSRYSHLDMNNLPQFGSNKFCRFKGILVQCGPWGLEGESDFLYHNRGDGTFEEVSVKAGVHDDIGYYGLGVMWVDYDDDGWLDILVANGHVYPQIDTLETGPRFREPLLMHRNNRDGTFDEVAKQAGLPELPMKSRRGAAFGDVFNTGNVDVLLLNVGEPPSLLKNMTANGFHRVLFRLIGTKSNRAAIGARVTIRAAGVKQFSEVHGGSSYLSQNDLRLHFGLGTAKKMESVEIRWPSGKVETLENVAGDAIYTIVEGSGIRSTTPLPPPAGGATNGAH